MGCGHCWQAHTSAAGNERTAWEISCVRSERPERKKMATVAHCARARREAHGGRVSGGRERSATPGCMAPGRVGAILRVARLGAVVAVGEDAKARVHVAEAQGADERSWEEDGRDEGNLRPKGEGAPLWKPEWSVESSCLESRQPGMDDRSRSARRELLSDQLSARLSKQGTGIVSSCALCADHQWHCVRDTEVHHAT